VRYLFFTALVLNATGCGACSDHGAVVDGPHPYVRCIAVDPPEPREGQLGATRFAVEGRELTIDTTGPALRIAAFRGPGRVAAPLAPALSGLGPDVIDLVLVLGGLGATEEAVTGVLTAVASLGVPAVVLPGGEDDAVAVEDGFDALDDELAGSLFDGRRLRSVKSGQNELVLVPGAPEGRYAADRRSCGISADDLEEIADDVSTPDEGVHRYLVSWAAPAGAGPASVSLGFGGVEAGDVRIAELADAIGAVGGLFAFPETRALVPALADGSRALAVGEASVMARLVLLPAAGVPVERDDGSLVRPAPAMLALGPDGLALHSGPSPSGGGDGRALTAPGPPL
jgi:hypothetical protein